MPRHFHAHLPHYFSKHPSRSLVELFWSVGILDFATAAVSLFEPIFLYVIGYSLAQIMLFYLITYGAYILLLPFGAKIAGKAGYEHAIFYSQFFFIAYYLCLFAIPNVPAFFFAAPIIFAIQKALYWPAFHADVTVFSQAGQRGRELGSIITISRVAYILGPVAAGFLLERANFSVLFIVASCLFLVSTIPLFRMHEVRETTSFSYPKVFRTMREKTHRRNFFAFLGFGEELIVLTLWPIFIYTIVGDFLELGSLVALATVTTALFVLLWGKMADRQSKQRALSVGVLFAAIAWILRIFARSVPHVFGIDTLSRSSKEALVIPLFAQVYEYARREGPLTYMVFFESSLGIGKFLTALLLFILFSLTSISWPTVFIIGAALTLLYLLFKPAESNEPIS